MLATDYRITQNLQQSIEYLIRDLNWGGQLN